MSKGNFFDSFFKNMEDGLDDLLSMFAKENKEDNAVIESSAFYKMAVSTGTLTQQTSGLTIFLPLKFKQLTSNECFEEIWNRHVVRTNILLTGRGVMELTSLAGLVYAVDDHSIAGCPLSSMHINLKMQNCIFHAVEVEELPEIRPTIDSICHMSRIFLSGQQVQFGFEPYQFHNNDDVSSTLTLFAMFSDTFRKPIGERSQVCWTKDTVCRVKMPVITGAPAQLMLWFRLYDNTKGYVLITRLWPWFLQILPCPRNKPRSHLS